MGEIYLVRHGSWDRNRGGLTTAGVEEVRGLAAVLQGILPNGDYHLLSSPTSRTCQTAQILLPVVNEKSSCPVTIAETPYLSELLADGVEELRGHGARILDALRTYFDTLNQITIMISHKRVCISLALAAADAYEFQLPTSIRPRENPLGYTAMDNFHEAFAIQINPHTKQSELLSR